MALIIILPISFISLRSGYEPAKYFFFGIILINPAGIYHFATEFGLIPASELGNNGYLIASIFLIWFFSQAVSDRISLFKSEKDKAERELHKSEEQLALVVKGADLGTWDWDIVNNIYRHNSRWFEILGLPNSETKIDSQVWNSLIHEDDKPDVLKNLNSHLTGEEYTYQAEYRLRHKSGEWIWVSDWGKIIEYDEAGNPTRAAGTMVDITKRKRAEISQQIIYNITNAVSTTENMYAFYKRIHMELNKLIEAKNFQVGLYDETRDVIVLPYTADTNDNYKEIPSGKSCSAYVIKNKQALLLRASDVSALVAKGEIEIFGTPSKVWLGVPLQVDGKVIGLIFVQSYENENAYNEEDRALLEFVSDQIAISIKYKEGEQALRESEEKFRLYVENTHDGVLIIGDNLKVDYANNELSNILGYSLNEIIQEDFRKFLDDDGKKILTDRYRRERAGGKVPHRYESIYHTEKW